MRRFAPARALARCSLSWLSLALAGPALAQEVPAPAPGTVSTTTEVKTTTVVEPAPTPELTKEQRAEKRREQLMRRANTYYGAVGGIHVVEAGSGAPQSFRLQAITDFFYKNDYLYNHDKTRYVGSALSLSVTPVEHFEISAAFTTRSVRNQRPANALEPFGERTTQVQTIGNPYFDAKGYGEVAPGVTVGGDVAIQILQKDLSDSVQYAGTTAALRGNVSLDMREMKAKIPLELRANVGYVFDQSGKVVKTLERERLSTLNAQGISADTNGHDEFRQLAMRHERLAYNVNRVDQATLALGLEAPLELGKKVALHPIAEWEMWIPVNRQGYDCSEAKAPNGKKVGGTDSCLGKEGANAWQSRATVGARLYPGLPGLNLLAAVEIGLTGTTNFVRELAPTPPYRVMFAASYAVDAKAKPPVIVTKEIEKRVEVAVGPVEGRVRGAVVEQGTGAPVPNPKVSFPGRDVNAVLGDDQGRFVSYSFVPGDVQIELEAEGFHPGNCAATIAPEGGEVQATCELAALPRVGTLDGRVVDANGAAVSGITVRLTGPDTRLPITDTSGHFVEANLQPGEYAARVEQEGFLISVATAQVEARKQRDITITLTAKPKLAQVTVAKDKLTLKSNVFFNTDTAEIQTRSEPLLREVADTLIRTPSLLRVEVQGHTDNMGTPDHNRELSQRRAEAVREWLVRAGVQPERLTATGYGSDKPIAPNVSEAGRVRNRRVDFVITERGEQ